MQDIRLQIKRRGMGAGRVAILCLRQHVLKLALLLQLLQITAATDVLPLDVDLRVVFVVRQTVSSLAPRIERLACGTVTLVAPAFSARYCWIGPPRASRSSSMTCHSMHSVSVVTVFRNSGQRTAISPSSAMRLRATRGYSLLRCLQGERCQ